MDRADKKKIVATSWHPGGANAVSPVIKALIQEGKTEVVVIGHQFSEKIFRKNGIAYKTIGFYGLEDVSVGSMTELLDIESPDLILTGTAAQDENNRDIIEQTLTLAARRKKIRSLAVLDFWAEYSSRFSDIFTGEKFKFLPDKIAIMDRFAERAMKEEGFQGDRLVITGSPDFDKLGIMAKSFTESEKQKIRSIIGLNVDILIFYVAGVWEKENFGFWDLDNLKLINDVLSKLPAGFKNRVGVVTKLHTRTPEGDSEKINQYISQVPGRKIKLVDMDPEELILSSDLVLTAFSTLGVKAVYMKKPCISIQPGLKREDLLEVLTKNEIIPVGRTEKDCISLISKAITDRNYRKRELIRKAFDFKTDGKATGRVVELVHQMLEA